MNPLPYRWFGRDRPASGWGSLPAARPSAWGLPEHGPAEVPVPAGPLVGATALWRVLGEADEAVGPDVRSIALPLGDLDLARQGLEAAVGRPFSVAAVVALWCADLDVAGRTPPGQAPASTDLPTTPDVVSRTRDPSDLDRLVAAAPALADGLPPYPAAGASAGRVRTSEGILVCARLRCPGGCWLPVPAPFAYYGTLGRPLVGPADPERPAYPSAQVEALLGSSEALETLVPATLRALPSTPSTWRTQFWLALLDRVPPTELARVIALEDDQVELLARASHRTPAFAPLLAAVGEQRLLDPDRGFLPAEAAAWASADPTELPPRRRAAALALQARGLADPVGARLFCEARDRWTGALDVAHPEVEELVLVPLRAGLVEEEPDPVAILRHLRHLEGAGGPEALADVLDRFLAEGTTTPTELAGLVRRLAAADASWIRRATSGSVAGSWLR